MLLQRSWRSLALLHNRLFHVGRIQCAATSDGDGFGHKRVQIEVSPDGSTIACWHPEPTIPYEHTMPLPRRMEEISEGDSALKVQYLLEEKHKYRETGPTDLELMKIFHTNRAEWRPRPRRRYAMPKSKDRKSV